jgi:hypothetical protein
MYAEPTFVTERLVTVLVIDATSTGCFTPFCTHVPASHVVDTNGMPA